MSGERLDATPFWLMRQAGRYLPEYRALRARARDFLHFCLTPDLAVEATLQPIRRFRPDAAILFCDILVVPHALGQPVRFVEGEGPRLDPIRDEGALASLDDGAVRQRLAPVYETVAAVRAALPRETALIGFAGSPWTVACYMVDGSGSKDFRHAKAWSFAEGAGFDRLCDLLVEATVEHLHAQAEAGADALQLFDSWAGVLPEAAFRRRVVEPTARIVRALRARGVKLPVIGFPRAAGVLAEVYAAETGVDAIGLDSSVPLGWARERLVPRVKAVQGNLDPVLLLVGGTPMRRAAEAILQGFAGTPHIFNLGHGVLPETPPKHVEALASLVRDWRGGEGQGT